MVLLAEMLLTVRECYCKRLTPRQAVANVERHSGLRRFHEEEAGRFRSGHSPERRTHSRGRPVLAAGCGLLDSHRMPGAENHFVVYADMLGFRNLVLEHRSADAETLTSRRQNARTRVASLERGNPLQRRFKHFHETLEDSVTGIEWDRE